MNAVATTARPLVTAGGRPRPSLRGAVGGEILKLSRQRSIYAMLGLALLFFVVLNGAFYSADNFKATLERSPSTFVSNLYDIYLTIFTTGSGIFLLLVSARLVGMEYSGGTIRVLLARGTGRLRLLLAKLTALALLALAVLAGYLALAIASVYLIVNGWEGSFSRISSLPAATWGDLKLSVLIMLASMAVSVLIGVTAATVGRSLAFGVCAALAFFPVDNFGVVILNLLNALTRWEFFKDVSAYALGPNLNVLAVVTEMDRPARAAFIPPLVKVDALHAWLVVAAWLVAMVVVSVVLVRRRDVMQ